VHVTFLGGLAQALIGALLLGGAVAAGYASLKEQPYSERHPKRILVQHLHLLGAHGNLQVAPAAAPSP
jgi:hypothetical protein